MKNKKTQFKAAIVILGILLSSAPSFAMAPAVKKLRDKFTSTAKSSIVDNLPDESTWDCEYVSVEYARPSGHRQLHISRQNATLDFEFTLGGTGFPQTFTRDASSGEWTSNDLSIGGLDHVHYLRAIDSRNILIEHNMRPDGGAAAFFQVICENSDKKCLMEYSAVDHVNPTSFYESCRTL